MKLRKLVRLVDLLLQEQQQKVMWILLFLFCFTESRSREGQPRCWWLPDRDEMSLWIWCEPSKSPFVFFIIWIYWWILRPCFYSDLKGKSSHVECGQAHRANVVSRPLCTPAEFHGKPLVLNVWYGFPGARICKRELVLFWWSSCTFSSMVASI